MAISGNQLKAARALAGIDQTQLAERSGLGVNTIRNMESAAAGNIRARTESLDAVVAALAAFQIEFTNGHRPGVRMNRSGELRGTGEKGRREGGAVEFEMRDLQDRAILVRVSEEALSDEDKEAKHDYMAAFECSRGFIERVASAKFADGQMANDMLRIDGADLQARKHLKWQAVYNNQEHS